MYGIITPRGWLTPRVNGVQFWEYMRDPVYPMRTLTGAKAIARDWLHDERGPKCKYTIVNNETGKPEFTIEV